MSDQELIRGKVAAILNARELVINRGLGDGVRHGMKFAVLDPKLEDIRDPETGESLGPVYRPKVRVEAISVDQKKTIARTYERLRNGDSSGLAGVARLFQPSTAPRYQTLRAIDAMWEELDERKSYVKVGDTVEEILESAEEIEESQEQVGEAQ